MLNLASYGGIPCAFDARVFGENLSRQFDLSALLSP